MEGVGQVGLDRTPRDEELRGDLGVGEATGGQRGDSVLRGRQRRRTRPGMAARSRSAGNELRAGAAGEQPHAVPLGQVERLAQHLLGVRPPVGPAQGGAEVGQRPGVLEAGRRPGGHGDRLLQQPHSL